MNHVLYAVSVCTIFCSLLFCSWPGLFAQSDDAQPLKESKAAVAKEAWEDAPIILLPALPPPVKPFEPRLVPPAPPAPFVPGRVLNKTEGSVPVQAVPVQTPATNHVTEADVAALALGTSTNGKVTAREAKTGDGFFVVRVLNGVTHVFGSTKSLAAFERGQLPPARRVFVRQSRTGGDIVIEENLLLPDLLPRLIKAYNAKFGAELNDYSPAYRVR